MAYMAGLENAGESAVRFLLRLVKQAAVEEFVDRGSVDARK